MKRAKQYLIVAVAVLSFVTCGKNEKGNPQPTQPEVSVTGTYELLTGEPLSTLTLTGTATHDGQAVAGAFAWKDDATTYRAAGQYDAPWVFTPPRRRREIRPGRRDSHRERRSLRYLDTAYLRFLRTPGFQRQ